MLLERAATFFQSQGYHVKVNPCIIGDSGAIHTPDLQLQREGEKGKAVFVLEALDGPMPLEGRAAMARDMGLEPVFVVGSPSPEVAQWAERHRRALLTEDDLPADAAALEPPRLAPPAAEDAATPPIPEEDAGAEVLPPVAPPRIPERPLTAFAPGPAAPEAPPAPPAKRAGRGVVQFPAEVPEDGDAVLLPSKPRADAPPPRPRRAPSAPAPAAPPADGDALLLTTPALPRPVAAPMPAPPAATPSGAAPEEPPADTGAELLPSRPTARQDADKVMKHDLSIWDPRSRLAQVKQAAKAGGFETTGAAQGPSSAWLRNLKKA